MSGSLLTSASHQAGLRSHDSEYMSLITALLVGIATFLPAIATYFARRAIFPATIDSLDAIRAASSG